MLFSVSPTSQSAVVSIWGDMVGGWFSIFPQFDQETTFNLLRIMITINVIYLSKSHFLHLTEM